MLETHQWRKLADESVAHSEALLTYPPTYLVVRSSWWIDSIWESFREFNYTISVDECDQWRCDRNVYLQLLSLTDCFGRIEKLMSRRIDHEQERKPHLAISMKVPIVVAKSTFPITRHFLVILPGAFCNDYLRILTEGSSRTNGTFYYPVWLPAGNTIGTGFRLTSTLFLMYRQSVSTFSQNTFLDESNRRKFLLEKHHKIIHRPSSTCRLSKTAIKKNPVGNVKVIKVNVLKSINHCLSHELEHKPTSVRCRNLLFLGII